MSSNFKDSIIYQIYPRSYKDSNGDGVGDLKGIIEKLPYLENLGINVIWLSPVYSSPNDDNGYDISDYYNINSDFGTLEDMDMLINTASEHGIKIVMDLVVNHSSDEHEWFKKGSADINSKYHDYYIWVDGKEKPNNWRSFFQGSVWEYVPGIDKSYLHLFSKKQPDLNWNNMDLRKEVYDNMKFWLDRGVGGFRMDVCNLYVKADLFKDVDRPADVNGYVFAPDHYANNHGIHEIMQEMNQKVFSNYDCITVGEAAEVTPEEAIKYVGADRKELNMVFHFELASLKEKNNKDMKRILKNWFKVVDNGGWNSNYLSNHDQPRQVSAYGNDKEFREESATLLATLNFALPGTPYIYQGEEIGMTNMKFDSYSQINDIDTLGAIETMKKEGKTQDEILDYCSRLSRDNARTPMQWDTSKNGGFTSGNPWLVVNPNYSDINVTSQLDNKASIFSYYKSLIKLRKNNPVLIHGNINMIYEDNDSVIALKREYNGKTMLAILNRSNNETNLELEDSDSELVNKSTVLNNIQFLGKASVNSRCNPSGELTLKPWEAIIAIK